MNIYLYMCVCVKIKIIRFIIETGNLHIHNNTLKMKEEICPIKI